MDRTVAAAFLLLAVVPAVAQDLTEEIASGVRHHRHDLVSPRNVVHVLEFDLADRRLGLELGFPGGTRSGLSRGYERTSSIAPRHESPGHDVLAATNAGFFEVESRTGERIVLGPMASGGELVGTHTARAADWEVYMLQASGEGWVGDATSTAGATATFPSGGVLAIGALNRVRTSGTLTLYTPAWGPSTGTRLEGVEVVIEGASGRLQPDQEVVGRIARVATGAASRNNAIPAGGYVLSATGLAAAKILRHATPGAAVRLRFDLAPRELANADLLVGGAGRLLEGGRPATARWSRWGAFATSRHPRTAIAWNGTRHWLVTVDGRRSGWSSGMSFAELADFLLSLGARDAMNLDGGGSTAMWVDGQGVVNRPSDASGERAVGSALLLVDRGARAPTAPAVDRFARSGRALAWDDKFVAAATAPSPAGTFPSALPTALAPDGWSLVVRDPAGGYDTTSIGHPSGADYTVEALVHCDLRREAARDGSERVGIFARDDGNANFDSDLRGGGSCYALVFDAADGRFRAIRVVRGRVTEFPANAAPLAADAWVHLRIVCRGPRLTFEVDGRVVADVADPTHPRGRAGIGWHETFRTNSLARGARVESFALTPLR